VTVAAPAPAADPSPGTGSRSPLDTFRKLDRNADGFLSDAEAGDDAALLAQFAEMDTDNDRSISSAEYAAAMAPETPPPGTPPFDILDTDRDGSLSSDELAASPGGGSRLIDLDRDRDGLVSPEEYLQPRAPEPAQTAPPHPVGEPSPDSGAER
jgi:hypothetical protein